MNRKTIIARTVCISHTQRGATQRLWPPFQNRRETDTHAPKCTNGVARPQHRMYWRLKDHSRHLILAGIKGRAHQRSRRLVRHASASNGHQYQTWQASHKTPIIRIAAAPRPWTRARRRATTHGAPSLRPTQPSSPALLARAFVAATFMAPASPVPAAPVPASPA